MGDYQLGDTIVAVATPPGVGAVAVLRLSGPEAFALARARFEPVSSVPRDWPPSVRASTPGCLRWNLEPSAPEAAVSETSAAPGFVDAGSADDGAALDLDAVDFGAITPETVGPGSTDIEGESGGVGAPAPCPVLAWTFPAPGSYTREDVVEFHLPGAEPLARRLVEAFARDGARPAAPGEFTARAVRLGRLAPDAAMAVGALVHAATDAERRAALARFDPRRESERQAWRRSLLALLAELEAALLDGEAGAEPGLHPEARHSIETDSSDADDPAARLRPRLAGLHAEAERRAEHAERADARRAPFRVRLAGPVNAGKSALFNALAGDAEPALVSSVPGTTRDRLSRAVRWRGVSLLLEDGPGWEQLPDDPAAPTPSTADSDLGQKGAADDPLARQGALRRRAGGHGAEQWAGADLLLWCSPLDAAMTAKEAGAELRERLSAFGGTLCRVWTMGDRVYPSGAPQTRKPPKAIPEAPDAPDSLTASNALEEAADTSAGERLIGLTAPSDAGSLRFSAVFFTSALEGWGLDDLRAYLAARALEHSRADQVGDVAWARGARALSRGLVALDAGWGAELVAEDIRQAHAALSDDPGDSPDEALLAHLFAGFCVGK